MPDRWVRLVAPLALAVFVLANGPVVHGHAGHAAAGHTGAAERHADDDDADDCPCPDDGPGDSSCPCPGGCAYCSVAKVPCAVPAALRLETAGCVGEAGAEPAACYLPPFHTTLIRPPRV